MLTKTKNNSWIWNQLIYSLCAKETKKYMHQIFLPKCERNNNKRTKSVAQQQWQRTKGWRN